MMASDDNLASANFAIDVRDHIKLTTVPKLRPKQADVLRHNEYYPWGITNFQCTSWRGTTHNTVAPLKRLQATLNWKTRASPCSLLYFAYLTKYRDVVHWESGDTAEIASAATFFYSANFKKL